MSHDSLVLVSLETVYCSLQQKDVHVLHVLQLDLYVHQVFGHSVRKRRRRRRRRRKRRRRKRRRRKRDIG